LDVQGISPEEKSIQVAFAEHHT